jgi:hypothetical protein
MRATKQINEYRHRALLACLSALDNLAEGLAYNADDLAAGAMALDLVHAGATTSLEAAAAAKDLRTLADTVADPSSFKARSFAGHLSARVKTLAAAKSLH